LRGHIAEVLGCLDEAQSAIELGCKNPILRGEYLKIAEEWAIRAYRIAKARRNGDFGALNDTSASTH
jgi:hypothetical protein